jgi:hypothetical protein
MRDTIRGNQVRQKEVAGKKVLELGSYYVDGNLRGLIESWSPPSTWCRYQRGARC